MMMTADHDKFCHLHSVLGCQLPPCRAARECATENATPPEPPFMTHLTIEMQCRYDNRCIRPKDHPDELGNGSHQELKYTGSPPAPQLGWLPKQIKKTLNTMRSLPDWAKKMMYQHKPKCRTFTEVGADCNCKSKPAPAQSDDILDTMMPVPYENPLKQANDQAKQDLKLLLGASKGGVMGDSPVCASCHDAHVRAVNRVRKWAIEEERSRLEEIMRRAFLALTEPGSGKVKHATDILRSELK